jgi:perosamine synthetase
MADNLFSDHIPLMRPWLGEEEVSAIREVIFSGWVSLGPKVAEFEQAIAAKVGAGFGVATNAATSALHLSLQVLGVGSGDEVILPSFTCMANANAVIMAGAIPRFADIRRDTLNLDPDDVERRITAHTKAIMMVDQIGLPADLDAFRALARRRGLALVDDAATTLGGRYKGRFVGGHGVVTCFSFHPRKMITTGEGGMMMTDDEQLAERARVLRSTGANVSDLLRHSANGAIFQEYYESGYNYRMTDMQAAMGLVQLKKLDSMLEQRTQQARFYERAIAELPEVSPPFVPADVSHAYSSYCIRLSPSSRVSPEEVVKRMAAAGISCRRGIPPLHYEPYFASQASDLVLPETQAAARETMFLPIYPGLSPEQQEQVVRALKASLLP